ncbi:MAG: hypothetical protein H0V17_35110 [Deltaproteobacteria bacterium]|nr:hypothetical protein [Deltaproteobacteria bacterium]
MVQGQVGQAGGPGFYPQPNEWTCGPFALKHALLALGRMVDVTQIASTARTHWWSGTNEIQLARAARAFECDLILERRIDAEEARKVLIKHLREQTPVLLCVEEWSHWITVLRAEGQRFVVVDSQDDPLLSVRTWPQLRNWWRYHDTDYATDQPPTLYDLMAVSPRFRTTVKADFSVERVKFLRRPENRRLARHWNEYLEDLLEICKPPSVRIVEPLSMGEFLRRHQELLKTRVVYWHGDVSRDEVARILRDLRFVSETYGLVIPASMSRRALGDLAILVSLWACADRGINGMFGSPGADARSTQSPKRRKKRASRR